MLYTGTKSVTTAGTRVALTPSVRTPASWVIIQAKAANTGIIYVGGVAVSSTSGIALLNGDNVTIPSMSGVTAYDLQNIYIDASVNGEGVLFTYGRR